MRTEVHPHKVLLPLEFLHYIHVGNAFRETRALRLHFLRISKEGCAGLNGVVLVKVSVAGDLVYEEVSAVFSGKEIHSAGMAETIQRAGVHKVFKTLAVDAAAHPLHKVIDIRK